jgi:AcrR family transcriptional regulator
VTTVTRDATPHVDGRRVRWEEHKRERRQLIIDAAVAVIEEHPPGTQIHVQQIADRAGLARPAVYRHFADRADLDRAVQTQVIRLLLSELDPGVILEGSVEQVILRIVESYVTWAGDHPALHRVAVRDASGADGANPLRAAVQQIADLVHRLFAVGAESLGITLDADDRDALDPFIFGLVSQAVGTVRLWLGRPERTPSASALARRMADSVWFLIDGHARARGGVIDPTMNLEDIVAATLAGSPTPDR